LDNQPPYPPEADDLLDEIPFVYDYPVFVHQPTEGERLIDGFAILNACEEND
jgi:hypothetical protein